ncbi:hypothetical protein GJV76_03580 [Myroides sp. BIT-d1]|uniref:50S ribosomal protein L27 n=2 Tax=Flavobacteriaceae TaxID=49546 RepID=A0A6I3LGC2_9FLAO|nr:hypothetical protein [Myroides albus]MVX35220.1 hypothetical protein [Myroides sp. LoEW2-1]
MGYVVLLGILISIVYAWKAYMSNQPYNKKIAAIGLGATHFQIVAGVLMYFLSPWGMKSLSADAMQDTLLRLYTVEHPLVMIIAAVIITIGFSKAKRLKDAKKQNRTVAVYYVIGLILILSRIPWMFWPVASY